jgi:two-component system sensor histidine kinase KdpD
MVSLRRPQVLEARKLFQAMVVGRLRRHADAVAGRAPGKGQVQSILIALALVVGTTLCLLGVTQVVELHHVSSAYLIPVLAAAIRLGIVPAIVAAVGGVAASAFFFYEPIYDLRVSNPAQMLDLVLFIIVAAVTGELAARARTHAILAQDREREMRTLYAFSKRLAMATDPAQIYSAIQDHLSAVTGRRVVYFGTGASAPRQEDDPVPRSIQDAVRECAQRPGECATLSIDEDTGTRWTIGSVSRGNIAFGVVAIDIGRSPDHGHAFMQDRIDAALADATATLERLDVARAIGEAKLRAEAETLRAALMGSVSHGLRTPLASIMGSASILVQAPAVAQDARLADLAGILRDEAERLNGEIGRLLDASRISSAGVRPNMAWADVTDIVNAAIAHQRRTLAEHRVVIRLPDDLPLVHVDGVLIEQALGQVLDNAAKYSPKESVIRIEVWRGDGKVHIAVSDEGAGLSDEERELAFDRFYRGRRTAAATTGSGLGLWIARAFVVGCGGSLEAASEGMDRGTTVTVILPKAAGTLSDLERGQDD